MIWTHVTAGTAFWVPLAKDGSPKCGMKPWHPWHPMMCPTKSSSWIWSVNVSLMLLCIEMYWAVFRCHTNIHKPFSLSTRVWCLSLFTGYPQGGCRWCIWLRFVPTAFGRSRWQSRKWTAIRINPAISFIVILRYSKCINWIQRVFSLRIYHRMHWSSAWISPGFAVQPCWAVFPVSGWQRCINFCVDLPYLMKLTSSYTTG